MTEPPIRREFDGKDLASRLRAAPSVAIREPDEELLSAILVKSFNDRQIMLGADVLQYILPRIERSFESVRNLVDDIDHQAMIEKRNITIPFIREILNRNKID